MPSSFKNETVVMGEVSTVETGQSTACINLPNPPPEPDINPKVLDDILDIMDRRVRLQRETRDIQAKSEKLKESIEMGEEAYEKALKGKELLVKRYQARKVANDERESKKQQALAYWTDFGFDVEQLPTEGEYKFIYTKLADDKDIKEPEIFNAEQLTNLNSSRLPKFCKNGHIDYRKAMVEIRKELIKTITAPL